MSDLLPAQRYGPTSGGITGVLGLLFCAGIIVTMLVMGMSAEGARVALGAAVGAVLCWTYLLRPRVIVELQAHSLLLRNPFTDVRIPLASVRTVGVRAVTSVTTIDDRTYDAIAVGYTLRKVLRGAVVDAQLRVPVPQETTRTRPKEPPVQELMVDQILAAAERARERGHAAGPAIRRLAVLELGALVLLVAAFAISLLP